MKYVVATYAKGEGLDLRLVDAVSGPEAVGLMCLEAIKQAPIDDLNVLEIDEAVLCMNDDSLKHVPVKSMSTKDLSDENSQLKELISKLMLKRKTENESPEDCAKQPVKEEDLLNIKAVEVAPGKHVLVRGSQQWDALARRWTASGTTLSLEEVASERLRATAEEYTVVCMCSDGLWAVERKNPDGSLQWWSAGAMHFTGDANERTKWTTRNSAVLQMKMINALQASNNK